MAEKTPTEILGDPILRSEYRGQLAHALRVAKGYHGTEQEYQDLMETLADLERWLNNVFGQSEGFRFPENLENEVAKTWQKNSRHKIADVLKLGGERLAWHISETLENKVASDSGLFVVEMEGVILPPETVGNQLAGEKGESLEPARLQERVKELVLALGESGIHTDDIVLVRGSVRESMMRKVSYAILEIPKINREILACDQVGEATFVIYGIQSRKILMSEGKGELQERLGACALKVVYRNANQWKGEVIDHLLKDINIEELKKVDVRSLEGLRTEILKLIPNPEAWAAMKQKEKSAFKVAGMGLKAIATRFGVEGRPIENHKFHLKLGGKIFGEGHECLRFEERPELPDVTDEQLKMEILKLIPTPKAWAGMKAREKSKFKVAGMGLKAVATRFGLEGYPANNHPVHLKLGKKIFGEGHGCLKEISTDKLNAEIRRFCPTPEVWAGMKKEKKKTFGAAGMGLRAIARRFGVEGDPIDNHPVHLELGGKIFGEGHECLKFEKRSELSMEKLKAEILRLIPIPEAWSGMNAKEKLAFKVAGMGLTAVATRFGVEGSPIGNRKFHLELGRKVFGEGHGCLTELGTDELRVEILGICPNHETWAEMRYAEKLAYKVAGMGLKAIATKFEVEGNPIHNHKFHLKLGEKIYGEK